MDLKWIFLAVFVLAVVVNQQVIAEFYYSHTWPKAEELEAQGLHCVPGRTVIRLEEKEPEPLVIASSGEDEDITRRSHMNTKIPEHYCKICICTVRGDNEYCSGRPAMNVNECIRIKTLTEQFNSNQPYELTRTLAYRVRRVGGDDDTKEDTCIPFVSEYTDCTAENQCNGCNKCVCGIGGKWSCQRVQKCNAAEAEDVDYQSINNAMFQIQNSMDDSYSTRVAAASSKTPFVPSPPRRDQDDLLLDDFRDKDLNFNIATLLRNKRSVDNTNGTDSVKFYNTVDEINEDTLNGNESGTLQAHKVGGANSPKISRRTGVFSSNNVSESSLQIAYNEPKAYDPHLADNRIDAVHHDDQFDTLSSDRMQKVIGNHTQKQKDKDLSKLVVNELKSGKEIIGDKNAKIMSNITFTPENDTLTAMAFIAGNLLNKLWNMEKDSGEDSTETEVLKHEKIADLLDLFKEPLNLRQENFLKSALEQLSEAIDKDRNLKNVSLCEKIDETKNILRAVKNLSEESTTEVKDYKDCDKTDKKEPNSHKKFGVATEAISKINNVLSLLKKFQKVQKNLSNLKQKSSESAENIKRKEYKKAEVPNKLSQDESSSLNVFGNILDKITKLLMPPKRSKKIVKTIRNQNVLKNSKDLAKELKKKYNIDVDSSDLSPKDKLVFDYLSTVKRNPNCILEHLKDSHQSPITKTEGDILLNLSEFFKVKSFVDLIKLLEPETKTNIRTNDVTTTEKTKITTEMTTTTISTTTKALKKLSETKEKLKAHLKTIIDDLIEIQNAKGHPTNNISIVDALPCIYNILNADKNTQDKLQDIEATTVSSPVDKVRTIFNSLKQELISSQNRRSNVIMTGERPRSAIVWERIIKNFDGKDKQNTRRNLDIKKPKTFEELKMLIDQTESGSKTFKNEALLKGVPPSERLVLLKTLFADVEHYTNILKDIDNSMTIWESLSAERKIDLKDFVDNTATNIRLNDKIAKNLNSLKVKSNTLREIEAKIGKKPKENYIQKQSMRLLDVNPSYERNNVKLSRDSIINQLIKNRMELFIKIKKSKNADLENDINYSIAKKILSNLEIGNYALARELYKVIVSQKQKKVDAPNDQLSVSSAAKKSLLAKEPVVQFEEPRGQSQLQWLKQDIWLKQLSNLKNMRV